MLISRHTFWGQVSHSLSGLSVMIQDSPFINAYAGKPRQNQHKKVTRATTSCCAGNPG
jgi:hypothetical protein